MLQIVSGKFFNTDKCFEKLHRGVFYTNYRTFQETAIAIPLGRLLPSTGLSGIGTLTYEIMEKIERPEPTPSITMVSTGGQKLIDDVAAVIAFTWNVICTVDQDLLWRLTAGGELTRGTLSQKYLRRIFDTRVMTRLGDDALLNDFLVALIGLERSSYEGAIRAIRRYVTATHRIAEDTSLAYTLFVMSIEALAQTATAPVPTWEDYDESKRQRIDKALTEAPCELAERVRSAVLANEHIALSRRFRDFAVQHLAPAFFRAEANDCKRPIRRPDLTTLLKRAYDIRSGYVHRLYDLPKLLEGPLEQTETFEIDGELTLTFEGLARLTRHVITEFVKRGPKVERENFNWHSALPNVVTLPLDPKYWIGRPEGYTPQSASRWLQMFLQQISLVLLRAPAAALTDLTAILDKIEELPLQNVKASERRAILALYHLFIMFAGPKYERNQHQELLNRHQKDFTDPSFEHLAIRLVRDQDLPWALPQLETLFASYWQQRHRKTAFILGELLEAMFTLRLAEINRLAGNEMRTRELICFAVEAFPANAAIRNLENRLTPDNLGPIVAKDVLLPQAHTETNPT